jgi:predicted helicase
MSGRANDNNAPKHSPNLHDQVAEKYVLKQTTAHEKPDCMATLIEALRPVGQIFWRSQWQWRRYCT